jgi:hypothetical protein
VGLEEGAALPCSPSVTLGGSGARLPAGERFVGPFQPPPDPSVTPAVATPGPAARAGSAAAAAAAGRHSAGPPAAHTPGMQIPLAAAAPPPPQPGAAAASPWAAAAAHAAAVAAMQARYGASLPGQAGQYNVAASLQNVLGAGPLAAAQLAGSYGAAAMQTTPLAQVHRCCRRSACGRPARPSLARCIPCASIDQVQGPDQAEPIANPSLAPPATLPPPLLCYPSSFPLNAAASLRPNTHTVLPPLPPAPFHPHTAFFLPPRRRRPAVAEQQLRAAAEPPQPLLPHPAALPRGGQPPGGCLHACAVCVARGCACMLVLCVLHVGVLACLCCVCWRREEWERECIPHFPLRTKFLSHAHSSSPPDPPLHLLPRSPPPPPQ